MTATTYLLGTGELLPIAGRDPEPDVIDRALCYCGHMAGDHITAGTPSRPTVPCLRTDCRCREFNPMDLAMAREMYLGIADELSGDATFLNGADPACVAGGQAFAATFPGLPWPPYADLDIMLDAVKRAERATVR